jgi:Ca-activated chloride channel family protein
LSPKIPQRQETSRAAGDDGSSARAQALRLCLPLCLLLASPLVARRVVAQASQATPQQPAPTPSVRPRTVGTKAEAARPAAQPDNTGSGRVNSAGSQESEAVGEDEVVRVDSNLVIIPATVVDGRGRAVTDLKVEDFELRVDGEVKQIGDLSRAATPVQVALLFDNSASLSSAREFEKQAAVRFFQSVVRPIDRAAVYSVSTTATLSQPLTNDVGRLVRTVQNFGKPDGATALFDAVSQAADYMRALQGRKVLVIVSDGTDTVSDASFEDSVNKALRAECQVYVVQTRQVEDPNLHDTVSEQRMYKLSEQTGGAVYVPQSVEDLDAVFTQISLDLSQQYLLSYYPQDERRDNFFRFIGLRVKTRPSLRVRARKGFYPAAARNNSANSSRTEYVASAAARPPTDTAAQRRPNGGDARAKRGDDAGRKIGPDGPDEDDRPKPTANASDTTPTFTLTTIAASSPTTAAMSEPAATPGPPPTTSPQPSPAAPKAVADAPPRPSPSPGDAHPTPAAPAPKDEARPRKPASGGALNSKAINLPRPVYPTAARSAGAQGKVVVAVTIDEDGKVVEAHAVSGHPLLQHAAVQAARLAKFAPAMLSGQPIKVTGTISYTFVSQ